MPCVSQETKTSTKRMFCGRNRDGFAHETFKNNNPVSFVPMNKLLRTLMVLASLALTSALFGASFTTDLGAYTAPGYVTPDQGFSISLTGSGDWIQSGFSIINTDTNQEVLAVGFMHVTSLGGWLHYVDSAISGVSVTVVGTETFFTGLPEGNYTIQYWTEVPTWGNGPSWSDGGGNLQLPTVAFNSWGDPDFGDCSVQFSGYVY